MSLDVRPQWTQSDRFAFRLFLAKPDHRDDLAFPEAWYIDDNPDNHLIQTTEGIAVRTLYDRLRLSVVRVRSTVPAPEYEVTLGGVPFGPFTESPLQFEVWIEGLAPYSP